MRALNKGRFWAAAVGRQRFREREWRRKGMGQKGQSFRMVLKHVYKFFDTYSTNRWFPWPSLLTQVGFVAASMNKIIWEWWFVTSRAGFEKAMWLNADLFWDTPLEPPYPESAAWGHNMERPRCWQQCLLCPSCVSLPTWTSDMWVKESSRGPQPQPPSDCNCMSEFQMRTTPLSPVNLQIHKQNKSLLFVYA